MCNDLTQSSNGTLSVLQDLAILIHKVKNMSQDLGRNTPRESVIFLPPDSIQ